MKTAEEKAEEYVDREIPIAYTDETQTVSLTELRQAAKIDYLAGYNEAMRWRDPKDELPEIGEPVIVKYMTAKGKEKYGIAKYFELGIGNPWTIEGSTGREVIGWRPIE